jgi:DNA repair protein SbcD/Mre11
VSFRFLHLADLHLETRFGGRERTRERLRAATLEAFDRGVELALTRGVHAVLIAGDAFDDPLLSRRVELRLVRGLERLARAGVTVVYACGNHDPGAGSKRVAQLGLEAEDATDWTARIHLLRGSKPRVIPVNDAQGEAVGVVVGAGHSTEREERNLAARFTPQASELPVVGLLHTQVEDALGADEHQPYAPCEREDLAHLDYDYFALGHVHQRQRPFPDVPAWYPGNLQGRNPRELGPKGGLLVELQAGEPVEPEFVALAPVVWDRCRVEDLAQCTTSRGLQDHLRAVCEGRFEAVGADELVLVFDLAGDCPIATALRDPDGRQAFEEDLAEQSGALEVQLRTSDLRTPRDLAALRATPSVLGQALELLERARKDEALLEQLAPADLPGLREEQNRSAYLLQLLAGLEQDLLTRGLEDPA